MSEKSMKSMKENKVVKLSDRTHALKRSARYLGSIIPQNIHRPILEDGSIVFKEITYVPAFLKIIDEFIDNSIDEALRTDFKFANKISINIDNKKIQVEDNGRGIPVVPALDEHGKDLGETMPELAWTELKAGSNFDDDNDNTNIGQNGEGASLGVIFSKKFIGETDDGKKHFKISVLDNLGSKKVQINETKGKTGTKIVYYPDLEKLNLGEEVDTSLYGSLIHFRLLYLALTYPDIDFRLNNRLIKTRTFRELNKEYFDNKIIFVEDEHTIIGISPSEDGYKFIHFINGINVYNGGEPLEYVEKRIFTPLMEKLQRKHKNIKINDIRNKVTMHVIFKEMIKPRFADQIKSLCVNTASQFSVQAKEVIEMSKSRYIDKIYKTKEIIDPIVDLFKAQEMIKEQREAKKATKKKRDHAKYWKPAKEHKYFVLSEGDSALGSIIPAVGRYDKGFFPLKGKILNALKQPLSKLIKNDELMDIVDILDIEWNPEQEKYSYENIVIATDADLDGIHISALLITFFYKYCRPLLTQGRIYILKTPLIILYQGDILKEFIFDLEELKKFEKSNTKKYSYKYTKGLGSLSELEWDALFEKFTFEELLYQVKINSEDDFKKLELWMNEDTEYRKKIIKENISKFNINNI